ncbi:hypothetical protein CVT24_007623, partial [Panaeolus cyanescens]
MTSHPTDLVPSPMSASPTAFVLAASQSMIPYPSPTQTPLPKSQDESMAITHPSLSSSSSSSSCSSSSCSSWHHPSTSPSTSPEPPTSDSTSLSPQCPDLSTCTQIPDLYFPDGNLILKAQHTIFKIYRHFLCARSVVFKDMFEFPPPREGNLMWRDCVVVELWDDERDVEVFLRALFDSSFFEPPPAKTTIQTLRGILRLSTKYDVPYLRRRAILHLESTFPTTLSAWKKRDQTRTLQPIDNTPFAALSLAREMGVEWVIPAIHYCVSSHPLEKVLEGTTFEDERVEVGWDEVRRCVKGRQELIAMQVRAAMGVVKSEPSECAYRHHDSDSGNGNGGAGRVDRCRETRIIQAEQLASWDMAGLLDYVDEN